MGMYTELVLKATLVMAPNYVDEVLNYLMGDGEIPDKLPDHPFFNTPRWESIGKGSSFYHHPAPVNSFVDGYIFSRSDLKNYDNEIQLFLDWVCPYVEEGFIGYVLYEECELPTLVVNDEGKPKYIEP